MTDESQLLIEWFERYDGEIFGIQLVDPESGDMLDQILMEREIAIEIAEYILENLK